MYLGAVLLLYRQLLVAAAETSLTDGASWNLDLAEGEVARHKNECAMAASQMAQQQAVNQLAQFNGQIKSKDDVSVQYQLVATGQTAPVVQNALQGKAKADGEDVLTPLLTQAATDVLTKVSQK